MSRMKSVTMGANRHTAPTERHAIKLPDKIVPNTPKLVDIAENTVSIPRIEKMKEYTIIFTLIYPSFQSYSFQTILLFG